MKLKKSRVVVAMAAMSAAVLCPGMCQAGLFDCLNPPAAAPLTPAPLYQAQYAAYMPTCDPCAVPQVNYVPEVKYRWKYSRIERTEYQPVASADPCTGCPVTTYRPVVKKSLLPWLHREAYTTYTPVAYGGATPVSFMQPTFQPSCSSPCDPCGSTCDPCGGASMAAPSLNSGCSSCAPATTTYTESAAADPGYPSSSQRTFQAGEATDWTPLESTPKTERTLKPQTDPQADTPSSATTPNHETSMPRLEIPVIPADKTASISRVRTVSYEEPALFSSDGNLYQAATLVIPLRLVPVE